MLAYFLNMLGLGDQLITFADHRNLSILTRDLIFAD